ncbi:hypothetical protein KI688_003538 [Linnemannia hyalina]|uniref:Uncharacterized protein n=1 Tax=Linnemannia hyalina TaxID=64524 RepID=A0A9P7XN39_9FUNG|nr:hypothetical protein KI688_003538 [Linnemannia hyalina]
MALLPDPPTPTMSQGGNSNSSQASLMTPSTPPSRGAPQNTIDHPDLFHSPDISARGPEETDSFTTFSTPLMDHASPPAPPPKAPQDRSPASSSSLVNPHTQPVEQGGWASSLFVPPPQGQSNHYAYNNQTTTVPSLIPAGATIIEPVASYTFNGSAYIPDSTFQPYPQQQQQQPISNYCQQEQQQYQTVYSQPEYHDPYQQQQQYHQGYPEPELVDTIEKVDHVFDDNDSTPEKNTGKRKRLYWIGGVVITILAGVLIGLVVSMKNKGSGNNNGANSNNSASGNGAVPSGSRSSSMWSGSAPTGVPVGTTLSNGVVVPPPTGTLVVVPASTTTSGTGQPPVVNPPVQTTPPPQSIPPPVETTTTTTTTTTAEPSKPTSGGGGNYGPRVPTPPLPSLPAKGTCGPLWCSQNYYWWCMQDICVNDGDLKACKAGCTDQFCPMACEHNNGCMQGCQTNYQKCEQNCA